MGQRNEMISVARCRDPGFCGKCSGVFAPEHIVEWCFPVEIQYKSRVTVYFLVATFKKSKKKLMKLFLIFLSNPKYCFNI